MNSLSTAFSRSWHVLFLLAASAAAAAGADIAPPRQPLLPRAPARSEWTVQIRSDHTAANEELLQDKGAGNSGGAHAEKSEIQVSKSGDIYREISTNAHGQSVEKWIFPDFQGICTGQEGVAVVHSGSSYLNSNASDYLTSDFEELEWVDQSNYKGVKTFQGKPVYVFETPASARTLTRRETADLATGRTTAGEINHGKNTLVAFLDTETQLPVYFDDGEVVRTYVFRKPEQPALIPPAFIAQARSEEIAYQKKKSARPLPP